MKGFSEGDIPACFDRIEKNVLVNILREKIHDQRFLRLIAHLFEAGSMEAGKHDPRYRGVPQGSGGSPVLSNIVLDRLDKDVEQTLIPAYTRGQRRKTDAPDVPVTKAASEARQPGDVATAQRLNKQARTMPSREPLDPNFRRLWYCRYCDDFLLGYGGTTAEALERKRPLATFFQETLALDLSEEPTLLTHAREEKAPFLGYEVHPLYADEKHDQRGQRGSNGAIGLRGPATVLTTHGAKDTQAGRPRPLLQRMPDSAYGIVAQYQTEYQGVVRYYRMAYNLPQLQKLKRVMETSLTRTRATKFKTSRTQIYRRFRALHHTEQHTYKVLEVRVERGPTQAPLVARFGGIPLRWNRWAKINDAPTKPIWSGRSEVGARLLADPWELGGATDHIEVQHIRKLKDLDRAGQPSAPRWAKAMAARGRKTLVVCQACPHHIQYGRYDGPALSPKRHWRAG